MSAMIGHAHKGVVCFQVALHDVELDEFERLAEQVQQQPRLVAVARVQIVVEPEHSPSPL